MTVKKSTIYPPFSPGELIDSHAVPSFFDLRPKFPNFTEFMSFIVSILYMTLESLVTSVSSRVNASFEVAVSLGTLIILSCLGRSFIKFSERRISSDGDSL